MKTKISFLRLKFFYRIVPYKENVLTIDLTIRCMCFLKDKGFGRGLFKVTFCRQKRVSASFDRDVTQGNNNYGLIQILIITVAVVRCKQKATRGDFNYHYLMSCRELIQSNSRERERERERKRERERESGNCKDEKLMIININTTTKVLLEK